MDKPVSEEIIRQKRADLYAALTGVLDRGGSDEERTARREAAAGIRKDIETVEDELRDFLRKN